MDGVPGLSFPGIAAGETFTYRMPVRQSATYWYQTAVFRSKRDITRRS